jgi:uncharacterized membrane protein
VPEKDVGEEPQQTAPPAHAMLARAPTERIETDSSFIIVRFGTMKGPRKARDAHALYFPIEFVLSTEPRCLL